MSKESDALLVRYRAALKSIRDYYRGEERSGDSLNEVKRIARAALAGVGRKKRGEHVARCVRCGAVLLNVPPENVKEFGCMKPRRDGEPCGGAFESC